MIVADWNPFGTNTMGITVFVTHFRNSRYDTIQPGEQRVDSPICIFVCVHIVKLSNLLK